MQETWVRALGKEDPLEKEMATHSSVLAREIPWTEEPGRLQSMGSQRVRHDLATKPPRPFLQKPCYHEKTRVNFLNHWKREREKKKRNTKTNLEFCNQGKKSFNGNEKQILKWTNKNWWKVVTSRSTLQELPKQILLGKGKWYRSQTLPTQGM